MSDATASSASLNLEIDTGLASEQLDQLELRLGLLGDNIGTGGAARIEAMTAALAALKVQASETAAAIAASQAARTAPSLSSSSIADLAKLREENAALKTQFTAANIELEKLNQKFASASAAGIGVGESLRGMAISAKSSIGDASVSMKALVEPIGEANAGVTKLTSKLAESQTLFANGINPGAFAKDVTTQTALATDELRKLEGILDKVRKASVYGANSETAASVYGQDIAKLVPHLTELEAALAKDKLALKLADEAAAKASLSQRGFNQTLREGVAASVEYSASQAEANRVADQKSRALSKLDDTKETQKARQVEQMWRSIEATDRVAFDTRAKLEQQHTQAVAKQVSERTKLNEQAVAQAITAQEAEAKAGIKALNERIAAEKVRQKVIQQTALEAARAADLISQINARRAPYGGVTENSGSSILVSNLSDSLNSAKAARTVDELSVAYERLKASVGEASKAEDYLASVQLRSAATAGAASTKAAQERTNALNSLNTVELQAIRREEQLAIAYAKRNEASQLRNSIEARRVLDAGLDPSSSFSAQSIEAAKAAESVQALQGALAKVEREERSARRSVDEYTNSIARAISLEKAWILSTEKVRVAQAIEVKKLTTAGWQGDLSSSYAPKAIALAQNNSLGALEKQYNVLSSSVAKSTSATGRWSDAAWEAHSAARGLAGSLGGLWATYGSLIPLLAGAAVGAGAKAVFSVGKDLQYQLKFVSELSDGATVSLDAFARAALGALQTPLEAADGMRALAQAGLDVETSYAALPSVLNLATVGELDVGAAALSATGAVHAFGLSMAEIGRVGDVFAKAAAISNTSVQGMTEAMKQASTVADFYGVSLEDTSATLALLAQRNIEGSAAGTAFRNMMSNLTSPTQAAKRAMKELNLDLYDGQGQLKGYREVLSSLSTAFANLDQKSRLEGLSAIFTERGLKGANTVLTDYAKLNDLFGQMENSAGFVNTAITGLKDTIDGDLKRAIAGMQLTFASVFNENEVAIHNLTTALVELVTSEGFKEFLDTTVKGFIALSEAIKNSSSALAEVGKVWLVAAGTMRVLIPGITALGVGLGSVTSAAVKAGVAFRVLNAATGWIGLLGTLAATFLLVRDNTDAASDAQERFKNRSDLLIGELDRQNAALQGQIDLLDKRKAALLSGGDASEQRARQTVELERFGKEIEKQAAAIDSARAKLNSALGKSAPNASLLGVGDNWKEVNAARAELERATAAKQEATKDYLAFVASSNEVIAKSLNVKNRAEDFRNLEQANDLNARVEDAIKKGRDIKPIDIQAFSTLDLSAQKAQLEEYKRLVGYQSVTFTPDKSALKAGADARKASITELRTDLNAFEGEYRASVERSKGLAAEMQISTEEMFDLQQQALVGAWAAANEKLNEMRALSAGDPKELANIEKLRQKTADDYVVNTYKLNNARLKANQDYYDDVEKLELASGAKTLSSTETFAREWYSKYGSTLEQALLRTKSVNTGIAESAVKEVAAILGAFDLSSYVDNIATSLKKVSADTEVFKNGLSTLVARDTNGGLVGALLGNARDIENWKAAYLPKLQAELEDITRQITNYRGDPKGLSALVADASKIRKEIEEGLRTSSPSVQKFSDDLGNLIAEGLVYGFKEGESPMKSFTKMMKAELVKAISGALSQQYNMIINTLLTGGGGGSVGSSGLGGITGSASGSSAFTNALSALGTVGTTLGALTTGLGAASASVAAVGLGGTLSAAGSLVAAGLASTTFSAGAAGVAAGVGLGVAALAPYVAVASLLLGATGAFKGSTPHLGGAYVASTDGTGYQATNENTPNFGLSWGAYRSDRSAGVDSAVKVMADGMAQSLAESMAAFDVDNSFKVAVKFASDNDDWSQGAFKVFNEAGAEVVDFSKKYTKDAAKALDQFGADTQRAVVAALATIDLGDPVNAIFDSVDPLKSSIEEIAAALQKAKEWVAAGKQLETAISSSFDSVQERLSAAFDAMNTAIPETADAYEALVRVQDLNTQAGREMVTVLLAAKPMWDEVQQAATQAAEEARSAWESLRDDLKSFRESLTTGDLAGLSPEAAYQAASAKFTQTDQLARLGNQDALGSLADVSEALLEASKAYYASGEAYFVDKQRVLTSVDMGIALADRKLTVDTTGTVTGADASLAAPGPELVNFTRPGSVLTAVQPSGATSSTATQPNRDEEIIQELRAQTRVMAAGLAAMEARLASLEKSSNEQARQARFANDRLG